MAIALIEVHTPVGGRSCLNISKDSGHRNIWLQVDQCGEEYKHLENNRLDGLMSEAEHADSLAKLQPLFRKAKLGQLQFGGRNPEAKTIERPGYSYIVELRPKGGSATVFGRAARIVRLYYAEPLRQSNKLLALHLATKPNGPDVLEEQNDAIITAGMRAETYELVYKQLN